MVSEDQTSSGGVEDIVVTAQRRSENLQKVPITVHSFSESDLEAAGITSTWDLARVTPGLVYGRGIGLGSTFLRGVGTGSSGAGVENSVSLRSEEHTSELQSLMRISYAVFCLKNKITIHYTHS